MWEIDQEHFLDTESIWRKSGFDRYLVAMVLYNGWFLFSSSDILLPKLDRDSRTFLSLSDFSPIAMLEFIRSSSTQSDSSVKYGPL